MAEFNFPVDIGNRALQHCGAPLMDAVLGFNENSKRAQQVGACYGRLRQALLRENVWKFATRRTVIRAIDTNTLLLAPALWSPTTTYFVGSIVADQNGTLWISNARDNVGNQPGPPSYQWEPYFGPLSVSLYDSSQAYATGELVYTAAGDGTWNVYLSLIGGNAVHPALPNQWASTTVYFKDQVVQAFAAWASGTTYAAGATVTYTDNNTYTSLVGGNIGNIPPSSAAKWALTPTLTLQTQGVPIVSANLISPPLTSPVLEWSIGTTYALGSFVMFNGTEYVSIANSNTGNFPNAAGSTFWKALTGGTLYISLIDLNLNNNPANIVAAWAQATTYANGAQVVGSDGLIYTSLQNNNTGNNPVGDGGVHWTTAGIISPWNSVFVQGGGNSQWMQIGGAAFPSGVALTGLTFTWPVGVGPLSQSFTRNAFRLPANYLCIAPQDPRAGDTSVIGAPTNLSKRDWEFEDTLLISAQGSPIMLRFVGDVQDVSRMESMFCELLALKIAEQVCEPLTQSATKKQTITADYERYRTRTVVRNAIETGADQPPLDDWIACRV